MYLINVNLCTYTKGYPAKGVGWQLKTIRRKAPGKSAQPHRLFRAVCQTWRGNTRVRTSDSQEHRMIICRTKAPPYLVC